MNRRAAREVAVHLIYSTAANGETPDFAAEQMFEPEYFATLKDEFGLAKLYAELPDDNQREYILALVNGVNEHMAELDSYIEKYSEGWKIGRISQIAAAVLRTAMFESMYMPDVPMASAIDAAVEILKGYEEERTVKFVNGVMGSFARSEVKK
ncbi:MAG: transcription antitermination factor NusB [Oscillospiraceae bacterium]|jgi:N utilization substance protein B|nr:transcription antitermination factor NusB [Oscillospiraceae bacterium]